MFRHLWDARRDQAAEIIRSGKRQLATLDKEIDKLLDLIMASGNTTAIRKYEEKIGQHEHDKALLTEKMANQAEPKGSFEEKLEPALTFLASPWKIWESGGESRTKLRRLVLKLTFTDRIKYCRNHGARTTGIALLFKVLDGKSDLEVCYGAGEGTRTPTP